MRNALKAALFKPPTSIIPKSLRPYCAAWWDARKRSDVYFNLTNIVINGDFSNGTTGWNYNRGIGFEVVNGIMRFTSDGSAANTHYLMKLSGINIAAGTKQYVKVRWRTLNAATKMYVELYRQLSISNPTVGEWREDSGIVVHDGTSAVTSMFIGVEYATADAANGSIIEIDYVMVFNLSTDIGLGMEPTKTEMDAIFSLYPIETVTASMNQQLSNGDFHDGTTGWLTSSFGTANVVDGTLELVADSAWDSLYGPAIEASIGDKIYACAYLKAYFAAPLVLAKNSASNFASSVHSGGGGFEFLSVLGTVPSDVTANYPKVRVYDSRSSGWDSICLNKVMVINLTTTFGAGNEPTKAEMDAFIQSQAFWSGIQSKQLSRRILFWQGSKSVKCNPDNKNFLSDYSGNNKSAKLVNFAYTASSGWLSGPDALITDGVDDYLQLVNSVVLNSPDFSSFSFFMAFNLPVSTATNKPIINFGNTSVSNSAIEIKFNGSTKCVYAYAKDKNTGGTIGDSETYGFTLTHDTWYTYGFVYDSATKTHRIYVNGVLLENSISTQYSSGIMSFKAMRLGNKIEYNSYLKAKYGFIGLFPSKALSASEIKQLHNANCKAYGLQKV